MRATLEHRTGPGGDDSGRQYYRAGADDNRTYRLKTNEDDPGASTYDDLAQFIRTINGAGLGGGDERFDTDAFRESVDGIMNARAFLRWAAVNVLLGSWDNYYATPSNYYLYNSGRLDTADDFMHSPYFTFIPWDYDNCWAGPPLRSSRRRPGCPPHSRPGRTCRPGRGSATGQWPAAPGGAARRCGH